MSKTKPQVFKSFKDAFNLKDDPSKEECKILKDGKPLNLEENENKSINLKKENE